MPVDASFLAARTSVVQVSDGTDVVLRPVVPEDKALLEEAFERLSPESRYRRFFSPMPRLPKALLAYLTDVDYHDHFAWAALVREDGREVLVGVSRYVRLPERPGAAEMAVAVIDPYQGRGIGSLLLDALVLQAIETGISGFEGYVLAENRPMQEILRRDGARFRSDDAGTLRFELDLPELGQDLKASPPYRILRAVARGEADLYQREPCPWIGHPVPG